MDTPLSGLAPRLAPALLLTAALALAGCDPTAPDSSNVWTITGTILNTTNQGVPNATVRLGDQQATTDAEGRYSLNNVRGGTYTLTISGNGYITYTEEIPIDNDRSVDRTLLGPNRVRWEVVSTGDGQAIALAAAKFYRGGGAPDPGEQPELTRINSGGGSSFNITDAPDGTFYVCVEAEDFLDECRANVALVGGSVDLGEFQLVEELFDGQFMAVVSWGAQPDDLDAHLTGPDGAGGRYHIGARNAYNTADASASCVYCGYSTQDGRRAFETIFFAPRRDGMYRYSVMNWTDRDADPFSAAASIAGSPTRVRVYDNTGLIKEYHAPQRGIGNTWRVFELTVSGGTRTFNDNGGASLGYFIAVDQNDPVFLTGDAPDEASAAR